jgi:hypothetical protein
MGGGGSDGSRGGRDVKDTETWTTTVQENQH